MERVRASLTILFQDPFWIGVYEREGVYCYEACKVTFGAEPRDYEVLAYFEKHWNALRFSPVLEAPKRMAAEKNPKRMQREISRQIHQKGIGTYAQQALSLQREQGRQTRRLQKRAAREAAEKERFAQRKIKKQEKHKGR